jgi:DNA polymerase
VHDDPNAELRELVSALRVHAERCAATGASGLVAATTTDAPMERPRPRAETAVSVSTATTPSVPVASPVPQGFGPTPEAHRRLDVLANEISTCTRCRLHEERTKTVFARGTGVSGLCFVGEGPGADEDAAGFPFVGKAGQLLDRMIDAMGFGRDDVYVCNIVKCRPPKNRKPEPDEMATCRPYLAEQIELLNPNVIVALGATAVEGLLGIGGGITRLRGKWRLYQGRIAVMPTFHPAYLLRTPEAKRDVWQDLQEVLRHMGRSVPTKK